MKRLKLRPQSVLTGFLLALPLSALYVYWFGFANRFLLFLYEHDMGLLNTAPFSPVTSSRYWMSGLLAAGFLLLVALVLQWRRARLDWRSCWVGAGVPLLLSIPIITMQLNEPVLPIGLALATAVVLVLALGIALWPLTLADWEREDQLLIWLDSVVLGGFLFGLTILPRAFEQQGLWVAILLLGGVLLLGFLVAMVPLSLHWWRDRPVAPTHHLVAATFALGYLIANLLHYLIFANGYFYISSSDNYFAQSWLWQLVVWLLFGGLAYLYQRWGNALVRGNRPEAAGPGANTYY